VGKRIDGVEEWLLEDTEYKVSFWKGDGIRDAIGAKRHILENRLVAGEITALYGLPKAGKTHVAIACAVACVTGTEFWGVNFPQNGKVIYVAAERHEQAAQRIRAQFLNLGYEKIPDNFILIGSFPTLSLGDNLLMENLKQLVKAESPSLMVFDTYVRMICNDEDNSRDADENINAFKEIVRQSRTPCSGVVVHHSGKDLSKGMRGSSAVLAAVTTVWKASQKKSEANRIVLTMEDSNDIESATPCSFALKSVDLPPVLPSDDVVQITIAVPAGTGESEKDRREKIVEIIKESDTAGLTIEQISANAEVAIGKLSDSTLRRILKTAVDSGEIVESHYGKKIHYFFRYF
jgi:hypothetical protein